MKRHVLLLAIASCWLGGDLALAQPFPPPGTQPAGVGPPNEFHRPPPEASGIIAANSKFVYVLRQDVLYRADAETRPAIPTTRPPTRPSTRWPTATSHESTSTSS